MLYINEPLAFNPLFHRSSVDKVSSNGIDSEVSSQVGKYTLEEFRDHEERWNEFAGEVKPSEVSKESEDLQACLEDIKRRVNSQSTDFYSNITCNNERLKMPTDIDVTCDKIMSDYDVTRCSWFDHSGHYDSRCRRPKHPIVPEEDSFVLDQYLINMESTRLDHLIDNDGRNTIEVDPSRELQKSMTRGHRFHPSTDDEYIHSWELTMTKYPPEEDTHALPYDSRHILKVDPKAMVQTTADKYNERHSKEGREPHYWYYPPPHEKCQAKEDCPYPSHLCKDEMVNYDDNGNKIYKEQTQHRRNVTIEHLPAQPAVQVMEKDYTMDVANDLAVKLATSNELANAQHSFTITPLHITQQSDYL